jgi:hypothetical protein
MIVGTRIIIARSPVECWNGERGRIHSFFTMANGRQAAIIRLKDIALEVCFPVSELEKEGSTDALQAS